MGEEGDLQQNMLVGEGEKIIFLFIERLEPVYEKLLLTGRKKLHRNLSRFSLTYYLTDKFQEKGE